MGHVFPLLFCLTSRLTEQTYATVYPCVRPEENQIRKLSRYRGVGHRKIRYPVNKKYITKQRQIEEIVGHNETYKQHERRAALLSCKQEGNILGYLRAIGYYLNLVPHPLLQKLVEHR